MQSWYVLEQLKIQKEYMEKSNNRAEHLMGASMERLENLDEMRNAVSNYVQKSTKKEISNDHKRRSKKWQLLYRKCAVCLGLDAEEVLN